MKDGVTFVCTGEIVTGLRKQGNQRCVELTGHERFVFLEKQQFPEVEELYIGKEVNQIRMSNFLFPNVKRIVSDSPSFPSSETGLLRLRAGLLLNTFCKSEEAVLDQSGVIDIDTNAFQGCRSTNIKNGNSVVSLDESAFHGFAPLLSKRYTHGLLSCGAFVLSIDPEATDLEVPERIFLTESFPRNRIFHRIIYGPLDTYREQTLLELLHVKTEILCIRHLTRQQWDDIGCPNQQELMSGTQQLELIDSPDFQVIDGILYSKDGSTLIACPKERKGKIMIPEGVDTIASYAFASCKYITEIVLPKSMRFISYAFHRCGVQKVIMGPGITIIGCGAFQYSGLKKVECPSQLLGIGRDAFYGCRELEEVILNDRLQKVEARAFTCCPQLKLVQLKNSMTKIRLDSFSCAKKWVLPQSGICQDTLRTIIQKIESDTVTEIEVPELPHAMYVPGGSWAYSECISRRILENYNLYTNDKIKLYECTTNPIVKQETAYQAYRETKSALILPYLKRIGKQLFLRKVQQGATEEALIQMLQCRFLTKKTMESLLMPMQEQNLPLVSAYLLQLLREEETEKKKVRMVL